MPAPPPAKRRSLRTLLVVFTAAGGAWLLLSALSPGPEGEAQPGPSPAAIPPPVEPAPQPAPPPAAPGEVTAPVPLREANAPVPPEAPPAAVAPGAAPPEDPLAAGKQALFAAVAAADLAAVTALLDRGIPVDAELPQPADPAFTARFKGTNLHYFVTVESGLTPLMLAAARGDPDMVRLLLQRGAQASRRTHRHRTFALWLAGRNGHVEVMQTLMGVTPESDAARTEIRVDLAKQTATVLRDGAEVRTTRISSGRKKFPTPTGRFVITDKHREWRSTLYPADMPFFMRLSCRDFGFHAGALPGYPASHGCIRLPRKTAQELFATVPVGTLVVIE